MLEFFVKYILVASVIVSTLCFIRSRVRDYKLLRKATNIGRGTRTERNLVLKMLKNNFDAGVVFHDLYIEKSDDVYSQIDMVVLSEVGLLVFEVKKYSGWLFGNCINEYWTQVLDYGKYKYRFYNPVRQNLGHIKALQEKLKTQGNIPYFSIVVFYGDCTLKNIQNIPSNTVICYESEVMRLIRFIFETNPKVHYIDRQKVIEVLQEGAKNGSHSSIRHKHILNIKSHLRKKPSQQTSSLRGWLH